MKILVLVLFVSSVAIAASNGKNRILPVTKEQEIVKKEKIQNEKLKAIVKEEEDCDDKAKKTIEIEPESISLTGDAGCSLDDAH
jgi:cell division protein FtsL